MPIGVVTSTFDDRGTTNYLSPTTANERLVQDMDEEFHLLEPDMAPLATITSHPRFSSREARSTRVEWLESERLPSVTQTNTDDGTGVAVSMVVTAGTGGYFKANDVLRIESTGERVLVTAVATDTLTIVRGLGAGGTGTAWGTTDGQYVTRLGNASLQGAGRPAITMTRDVAGFNYTQIQRDPWGATNTTKAVQLHVGPIMTTERRKKTIEHKLAIDYTLMWGARDIRNAGAHPQTFCGGIRSFITSNVTAVNGALTYAALENNLASAFRYGSSNKVGFCSRFVFNQIGNLGYARTAFDSWKEVEVFGAKARRIVLSTGNVLDLVLCKEWQDAAASTGVSSGQSRAGTLVIVDLDNIKSRPLRPTGVYENIQANDEDQQINEYKWEGSLQVTHERTHAVLTGIAALS